MAEGSDSDDKTEQPTPKRLKEAREKGNIAISREVSHAVGFAAAAAIILGLGSIISGILAERLPVFLGNAGTLRLDAAGVRQVGDYASGTFFRAILPAAFLMIVMSVAAVLFQSGGNVSAKALEPKFDRISPMAGLKRIFGMKNLLEFVKSLLKVILIAWLLWIVLVPLADEFATQAGLSMNDILSRLADLAGQLLIAAAIAMTVIAIGDYLIQRLQWLQKLKMSRQELKDEFKQTEGDPYIKGRLKQQRQQRARRRMMMAVPKADVIITNPTHFAVALRYDQQTMQAPILVAKGVDQVAAKIRELAREHKIPIVENPPLARILWREVDLDHPIPPEYFKAVAEIVAYVFRLRDALKRGLTPPKPPRPTPLDEPAQNAA